MSSLVSSAAYNVPSEEVVARAAKIADLSVEIFMNRGISLGDPPLERWHPEPTPRPAPGEPLTP